MQDCLSNQFSLFIRCLHVITYEDCYYYFKYFPVVFIVLRVSGHSTFHWEFALDGMVITILDCYAIDHNVVSSFIQS